MRQSPVEAMWQRHKQVAFPRAAQGLNVSGIDLVLLDSLASGCISTLLQCSDAQKSSLLMDLRHQLHTALPHLQGDVRDYFAQLESVVDATLSRSRGA